MERRNINTLAVFIAKIKRGDPLFFYLCISKTKAYFIMKVKLTQEQIDKILADPKAVLKAGIKTNDPWWVIVLKVIAYAIGLILAGAATTSCAHIAASAVGIF